MKLTARPRFFTSRQASVLLIVTILLAVSLMIMTGLLSYSMGNIKLNARNNDYYNAVGAAEAATEKVLSKVTSDFRDYGDGYLVSQLDTYRGMVPNSSESTVWTNFDFMNLNGDLNAVEVQYTSLSDFTPLGGQYGTLKAFKDRVRILSNARAKNALSGAVGSVYQDIELTRIPIFQYAIFYNIVLEFTPLPDMVIAGPVHCNTNIYCDPVTTLTFMNDVTSAGTIVVGAFPLSPLGLLGGTTTFIGAHDSGTSTLNLPIGTNNSPAAVRQVIELPPPLESASSSLGQQRYYNKADIVLVVSNSTIRATTGYWDAFAHTLPTNDVFTFVSTNKSFFNKRENKTVLAIQIDVAKLISWNLTNGIVRPFLPLHDVRTIYIADQRTFTSTTESGVRLINGTNLPPQGLTVATPSPLYIKGDYNVAAAAKGTTNTTASLPASVACDAITILSSAWQDTNSNAALTSRIANNTTINTAFLTGIVATTATADSGGVENFPRYLEDWNNKTNTYNGSMVGMYYSLTANAAWQMPANAGGPDHYNAPYRNWSLDQNYQYKDKLPPATPALTVLVRANWRTPAAYTTNVLAGF